MIDYRPSYTCDNGACDKPENVKNVRSDGAPSGWITLMRDGTQTNFCSPDDVVDVLRAEGATGTA